SRRDINDRRGGCACCRGAAAIDIGGGGNDAELMPFVRLGRGATRAGHTGDIRPRRSAQGLPLVGDDCIGVGGDGGGGERLAFLGSAADRDRESRRDINDRRGGRAGRRGTAAVIVAR